MEVSLVFMVCFGLGLKVEGEACSESVVGIVGGDDAQIFAEGEICAGHPSPILAGVVFQSAEHAETAGELKGF